jgi:Sigma-70 region 2
MNAAHFAHSCHLNQPFKDKRISNHLMSGEEKLAVFIFMQYFARKYVLGCRTAFKADTMPELDNERALLQKIHTEPEAFRQLYRHYFPRVYAYVAYRVGRRQDAEDVVADVFIKVVEGLKRFEYRGVVISHRAQSGQSVLS